MTWRRWGAQFLSIEVHVRVPERVIRATGSLHYPGLTVVENICSMSTPDENAEIEACLATLIGKCCSEADKDSKIEAYLASLPPLVRMSSEGEKRSILLKLARKHAKALVKAPGTQEVDPPKADADVVETTALVVKKRKRQNLKAPTSRAVPLPLPVPPELANTGDSKPTTTTASSMMTKKQRAVHEQKKARFLHATQKLHSAGSGYVQAQWKKKMSSLLYPGMDKEIEIPYKKNMTAAEVLKCREEEKGAPSATPPRAITPPGTPIPGLRYL